MLKLIEDQIYEYLKEKEEQRCKRLEERYAKNPETKNKKVKRNKVIKPWSRLNQYSLCQEPELLIMVQDYDYDLSDINFLEYCKTRGVLHIAGEKNSKRWKVFESYKFPKDKYLGDSYFQYAEEIDGKSYKYSEEEMEIGWRIIQIGRSRLQDCWEIYHSMSI
jgi:hypothetical protein